MKIKLKLPTCFVDQAGEQMINLGIDDNPEPVWVESTFYSIENIMPTKQDPLTSNITSGGQLFTVKISPEQLEKLIDEQLK